MILMVLSNIILILYLYHFYFIYYYYYYYYYYSACQHFPPIPWGLREPDARGQSARQPGYTWWPAPSPPIASSSVIVIYLPHIYIVALLLVIVFFSVIATTTVVVVAIILHHSKWAMSIACVSWPTLNLPALTPPTTSSFEQR
jgi:hypothetical protein